MQGKLLGFLNVDFDATGQVQIIYSAFVKYLRKKREYDKSVHQSYKGFMKAYDSVTREALYIVRIEFCIPKNRVKPIKMCPN
jgi:hypothetical protein